MSPYGLNLAAIASRSELLASVIDAQEPGPLEWEPARTGLPSGRYGGIWLHSRFDPSTEAGKSVDEALSSGADLLVLFGLGLGYHARQALDRDSRVLVVEHDPACLRACLDVHDLTATLSDPRLELVLCLDEAALTAAIINAEARSIALVANPAFVAAYPETAASFRKVIAGFQDKDRINAATLGRFGRLWVRNLARNTAAIVRYPGIKQVEGIFAGLPALVLAAGPSLDEILDHLEEIRKRCILVCVDTALRSVLARGVEPDFVVVVDPQYWNARHLDRCVSPSSILVSEAAVWPQVLRGTFAATIFCSSLYPLGRYIEERVGEPKGILGAGGSVATSAWDFARLLGCTPLFMAGLDLGFPDGKTHARASLFEQRALQSGTRLGPASSAAFQALRGGQPYLAPSNDGGMVVTDRRLSLYSWWFANKIKRLSCPDTFNLSAKGLATPGMPLVGLDEVLGLPVVADVLQDRMDTLRKGLAGLTRNPEESKNLISEMIQELEKELVRISGLASDALALVEEARSARGAQLDKVLAALSGIDDRLLGNEARDVVGFILESAADLIGGRARTLSDSLDKSWRLYSAVQESAIWHADCLATRSR
ncbi:MAG: motility associated factor glycosyltransferase family protein [Clostridia bacterium]